MMEKKQILSPTGTRAENIEIINSCLLRVGEVTRKAVRMHHHMTRRTCPALQYSHCGAASDKKRAGRSCDRTGPLTSQTTYESSTSSCATDASPTAQSIALN